MSEDRPATKQESAAAQMKVCCELIQLVHGRATFGKLNAVQHTACARTRGTNNHDGVTTFTRALHKRNAQQRQLQ